MSGPPASSISGPAARGEVCARSRNVALDEGLSSVLVESSQRLSLGMAALSQINIAPRVEVVRGSR
ncbi:MULTISPECIES: hypothetical protein [unclassified Streptomyces]|uniref:hypothetical protein n=1 Tax=unclassified Streptomyces TaxID=2593676 RepID=UPI002E822E26|nr:hypothetical protein [Streptomyces sp. NBC_00562]WTD31112.1 hypothetical protein OHB03_01950 [Streptomyces sp. NBC_01643]WUC17776.1 hypothetical protein OHA33_02165 [Streptomyces sp. NBC_00562]